MTFIDDHSWKLWASSVKMKDQVVKMSCGSSREPNTENAGLMESLSVHSMRERHKEKTQNSIQNNNARSVHSMCSVNTFIQVLYGLTEVLTVLQCSLRTPTLTPKYIPRGISVRWPPGLCTNPAFPTHRFAYQFTHPA